MTYFALLFTILETISQKGFNPEECLPSAFPANSNLYIPQMELVYQTHVKIAEASCS
jgi:hypothetical protein